MVKLETQHLKDANEQHINSAVFILQGRRLTICLKLSFKTLFIL